MTEVHRYKVVQMVSEAGGWIGYDPHGPEVVMASAYDQLKAENEALRKALSECIASLAGEMNQKYAGQKPEDMHPVTLRDYHRDIAELAGYRAAMAKEADQ